MVRRGCMGVLFVVVDERWMWAVWDGGKGCVIGDADEWRVFVVVQVCCFRARSTPGRRTCWYVSGSGGLGWDGWVDLEGVGGKGVCFVVGWALRFQGTGGGCGGGRGWRGCVVVDRRVALLCSRRIYGSMRRGKVCWCSPFPESGAWQISTATSRSCSAIGTETFIGGPAGLCACGRVV